MDFRLTKEQEDIRRAAREFAEGEFPERAQEFDREETFDFSIWKKACELGFVGMSIKEEYGGAGMGLLEECLVTEEFWVVDGGISGAIHSTVFGADLIDIFGSFVSRLGCPIKTRDPDGADLGHRFLRPKTPHRP